jgi:hypothetical protein
MKGTVSPVPSDPPVVRGEIPICSRDKFERFLTFPKLLPNPRYICRQCGFPITGLMSGRNDLYMSNVIQSHDICLFATASICKCEFCKAYQQYISTLRRMPDYSSKNAEILGNMWEEILTQVEYKRYKRDFVLSPDVPMDEDEDEQESSECFLENYIQDMIDTIHRHQTNPPMNPIRLFNFGNTEFIWLNIEVVDDIAGYHQYVLDLDYPSSDEDDDDSDDDDSEDDPETIPEAEVPSD